MIEFPMNPKTFQRFERAQASAHAAELAALELVYSLAARFFSLAAGGVLSEAAEKAVIMPGDLREFRAGVLELHRREREALEQCRAADAIAKAPAQCPAFRTAKPALKPAVRNAERGTRNGERGTEERE